MVNDMSHWWRKVLLLAVSSVVGGILAVGGTAGARGVTTVSPHRTIMVTFADNGHHYRLHAGDHLDVQLSGPSSLTTWTEPATSNRAVLKRTGGSSGMTATARFLAKAKGKAQVRAFGTINCSPPCPGPILLFRVNVSVIG